MRVDFNTNILAQLLNQHPDKVTNASKKFPKIYQWQHREKKPTIDQLIKLAKFFNIPFGYLFLNDIPQKDYPIPHYRSTLSANFKPSDELQETLQTIEGRQQWAKDILKDLRDERLPFANSISIGTNVEIVAQKLRDLFDAENRLKDEMDEAVLIYNATDENIGREIIRTAEPIGKQIVKENSYIDITTQIAGFAPPIPFFLKGDNRVAKLILPLDFTNDDLEYIKKVIEANKRPE